MSKKVLQIILQSINKKEKKKYIKADPTQAGTPRVYVKDKETGEVVIRTVGFVKKQSQRFIPVTKEQIDKGKDVQEKSKDFKSFSGSYIQKSTKIINTSKSKLKNLPQGSSKQRCKVLLDNWQKFIKAETYEERVQAVKVLAQNNLIKINTQDPNATIKKVYINQNIQGLQKVNPDFKAININYKSFLTGTNKSAAVKEMYDIIINQNIDVPLSKTASHLGNASGRLNQSGIVYLLDPNEQNKQKYESYKHRFKTLGGNVEKIQKLNKETVQKIKNLIPQGGKIIKAIQVGDIGKSSLSDLGIDPKTDPTDYIVYYEKQGKINQMKISAKIYKNPDRITMKTSGVTNLGSHYFGDQGLTLDKKYNKLKEKYQWKQGQKEQINSYNKLKFKEQYMKQTNKVLEKLSKSQEGQKKLLQMWKEVHGCNKQVYTQIINSRTGKIDIKQPNYYCNPNLPFSISYNGTSIKIDMNEKDLEGKYRGIQMQVLATGQSRVAIQFVHVVNKSKTEKVIKENQENVQDLILQIVKKRL